MYHPYFRGKQYELITVRESASILAKSNFVPIIEPVKQALGGLQKTVEAVCDASGTAIVVVNPHHGDHSEDGDNITAFLKDHFSEQPAISAGILLKKNMNAEEVLKCINQHKDHQLTLIHAGFIDAKSLVEKLGHQMSEMRHVFFERDCGKLYRKHFGGIQRVLLRDGFHKRRNRDHPLIEKFSDLHVTFTEEGMDGFGDFLIAGDEFSEGGGPAYAVAIHLTFVDPEKDDEMFVYHFKSVSMDTPTDPAGKFAQALHAMVTTLDKPDSKVFETDAVKEFRDLYKQKHFPGLGYVKKLSMKHHIETLAAFFS